MEVAAIFGIFATTSIPTLFMWRSWVFRRRLIQGKLATCAHFDLAPKLPSCPSMVLVCGAKGIGKSFAASHEAMLRRNAFYVEVEKDDTKMVETSNHWLQFLYDSGPARIGRLPYLPDIPGFTKVETMKRILRKCVVNGQLPTIVVDVHNEANVDVRAFMGALKVLHHDKKLINVILTAADEEMKFSRTNDYRWEVVPVREIGVHPARKFLDLKSSLTTEEKAVVLERMPRTAYLLSQRYDRMLSAIERNTTAFLTAMRVACTDSQRTEFAKQAGGIRRSLLNCFRRRIHCCS